MELRPLVLVVYRVQMVIQVLLLLTCVHLLGLIRYQDVRQIVFIRVLHQQDILKEQWVEIYLRALILLQLAGHVLVDIQVLLLHKYVPVLVVRTL